MQKDKFRYIRKNTKAKETGTTKGSVSNEISQRGQPVKSLQKKCNATTHIDPEIGRNIYKI